MLSTVYPATAVRKARRFAACAAAFVQDRRGGGLAMAAATLDAGTFPPTKLGMALYTAYLGQCGAWGGCYPHWMARG